MWTTWVKPAYDSLSWDYWFGQVDVRPLGVFRIVFALVLLKDALYRLLIGAQFYADDGIAPRHVMANYYRDWRWSLLDGLGADWQITLFFLLWIVVLVALLLGYRTRWMTILNWILILSIHERNIYMLNGADSVMRVISFWMIFLPLGRVYALDRLRKPDLPLTTFAFPLRIIQLQFAFIYMATFIMKAHGVEWMDGSAVYHALQLRSFTHPIADWLLDSAPYIFFQVATLFTLIAEGAFFPLMFLPFEQPSLKLIGLLLMGSVHIGIGVLMAVPNFSFVMLACYLLFFEGSWIVWLIKRRFPERQFVDIPAVSPAHPLKPLQIVQVLMLGALLFSVYGYNFWLMRPAEKPLGLPISDLQTHTVQMLGLWQIWDMFSPNPFPTDGGLLMNGTYADGQIVELRTGLTERDRLPRFYFGTGTRWKKYDENLHYSSLTDLMETQAHYYCRIMNANQPDNPLLQIEYVYRSRQVNDYGTPRNPYKDQPLQVIACKVLP